MDTLPLEVTNWGLGPGKLLFFPDTHCDHLECNSWTHTVTTLSVIFLSQIMGEDSLDSLTWPFCLCNLVL